jgi:hypothetical protein
MCLMLAHLPTLPDWKLQLALLQCIARDLDGRREVAGVHWDYDCYGAPGKVAQVGASFGRSCLIEALPCACMR